MKQNLVIKQTIAMPFTSVKKGFTFLLLASFLLAPSFKAISQTVVTNETFPNQFNANFPTTNNTNGTFVGSTGTWTASCNNTALSAIAVIPAYYSPVTCAIKIVNWNTAGKGAADCHAASPAVNLSGYACSPNLNLSFKLYTYTCSSSDPNSYFKVEYSADNGTTWSPALSLSSAQIFATYGANNLTTLTVDIPAAYRVSGFKYRFSGYKPANQANNFYLFIDDAKINAAACNTCTGRVTNLYFNELNGGADLPITNGSTFTVAQLGALYNLEAGTSGTIGSVKYTITGPTPTSNIENTPPYNSPGTGSGAWTGAVGTYSVNLKTYSASGATGTLCHDTTITFHLTTFDCNCPGANVVLNPGFESGTTNWTWSGGTLAQGTGGVACGTYSGDLNNTSTSSKAWQTIGTDLATGTVVNASVYAGTHDNTFNNWVAIEFLNASNVILSGSVYVQVDKILANAPAGPQLYNISATVPAGTKYTRVAFGGTGSYTKTDRWCANTTPPAGTGSIGDRVWLDANGNGIQDAAETGGITGVTVQLRNSANVVIATQTTNASGNYSFTGLAAGTYTVVFPSSISGAVVTTQNVGGNDDIDSDPSQATGITGTINLAAGQSITNVDAGYCPVNLQLGNRVWYDTNNNGINDAAENGIRNVTVNLYKDDNNDNVADAASIATLVTDINGYYTFSNLAPGNYIVGAVIPAGYMSSSINGGDPDNNTDLDDNGQVTAGNEVRGLAITLTGGAEPTGGNTNNTYDFGLLPDCACTTSASNLLTNASFENGTTGWSWSGGSLTTGTGYVACGTKNGFNNWSSGTSKVWQDVTIAAGSTVTFKAFAGTHAPGISCSPKLSLIFLNASNAVISQSDVTVTRVVGDYHDQLEQYSITAVAPAGTVKARVQSSITCNTMKLDAFCLTATPPASLGNFVWEDLNRNGLQDAGEPGIAGATVTLNDGTNNFTTTTNASGAYSFTNLASGTYSLTFTTPAGFAFTSSPNVGTDDAIDSDPVSGVVSNIVLATGEVNNTVDAGFYKMISLSGNVWHDVNGMTDDLVNNTGPLQTPPAALIPTGLRISRVDAVTGLVLNVAIVLGNGAYSFGNVEPGNYILVLSQIPGTVGGFAPFTTLPSGWVNTGEKLGLTPGRDPVINGKLSVSVTTVSVTNANFGIQLGNGDIGIN